MATSAFGNIVDDTIDLIAAIVPDFEATSRFSHVADSLDEDGQGERCYTTRDAIDTEDGGVYGGGEVQKHWILPLRMVYHPRPNLLDMMQSDHKDLIEALQPSRTYPSGSTWSLKIRRIDEPQGPELDDEDESIRIVTYPVHLIFRYQLTLI